MSPRGKSRTNQYEASVMAWFQEGLSSTEISQQLRAKQITQPSNDAIEREKAKIINQNNRRLAYFHRHATKNFHSFLRLPVELQIQIWSHAHAAENPWVLDRFGERGRLGPYFLDGGSPISKATPLWLYPKGLYSVVAVCRLARLVALEAWKNELRDVFRDDEKTWQCLRSVRRAWVVELINSLVERRKPVLPCNKFWFESAMHFTDGSFKVEHLGCCVDVLSVDPATHDSSLEWNEKCDQDCVELDNEWERQKRGLRWERN